MEISVDRTTAAQYGLTAGQVAQAVRGVISGTTATKYKYEGTEINVVIKGDEHYNESLQGLEQIPVNTSQGFAVTLGQVADIKMKRGPVSINRDDQERVITVSSQLSVARCRQRFGRHRRCPSPVPDAGPLLLCNGRRPAGYDGSIQ